MKKRWEKGSITTENLPTIGSGFEGLGETRRTGVPFGRIALLAGAGVLLYYGLKNRDKLLEGVKSGTSGLRQSTPQRASHQIQIEKSPEALYAFWRNFENLPKIMRNLESVRVIDDRRSHWRAKAPLGGTVDWEAEVTEEVPNEVLGWRSLPGAQVQNSGTVRFRGAPEGTGTSLEVDLEYTPPAGAAGALVAKLLRRDPQRELEEDLANFKREMERGGFEGRFGESQFAGNGELRAT